VRLSSNTSIPTGGGEKRFAARKGNCQGAIVDVLREEKILLGLKFDLKEKTEHSGIKMERRRDSLLWERKEPQCLEKLSPENLFLTERKKKDGLLLRSEKKTLKKTNIKKKKKKKKIQKKKKKI